MCGCWREEPAGLSSQRICTCSVLVEVSTRMVKHNKWLSMNAKSRLGILLALVDVNDSYVSEVLDRKSRIQGV